MSEITFELPKLFRKTKTNKIHVWRVWTQGKWLYRQDYQLKGNTKKDPSVRECRTTNVGKVNERNPQEQAIIEAARAWVKRLDINTHVGKNDEIGKKIEIFVIELKSAQGETNHDIADKVVGYVKGKYRNAKDALKKSPIKQKTLLEEGVGIVDSIQTMIKPMLANEYDPKRLDFVRGCWLQPKLDGVRAIARLQPNKTTPSGYEVVLTTRSGKQFAWLLKIKEATLNFLKNFPHVILDGEIYTHTLKDKSGGLVSQSKKFNLISGAARPTRKTPSEYETQLQYHVFDIVDKDAVQKDRFDALDYLFREWNRTPTHLTHFIQKVPYRLVRNENEINSRYESMLMEEWEGCIIRLNVKYQFTRTHSLLKRKPDADDEFVILAVNEGAGTEKGCAVFECITPEGKVFNCRPRGTFEERKEIYENADEYIGKSITVIYQDLGDDGIPRFPRAKALRYDK